MADEDKYKWLRELIEQQEAELDKGPEELWYNGEGDILDTEEGRAKFCQLNKSSVYTKDDPDFFGGRITVFNIQGKTMTIKRRCKADTTLFESKVYDADGKQTDKFYEPYEDVL